MSVSETVPLFNGSLDSVQSLPDIVYAANIPANVDQVWLKYVKYVKYVLCSYITRVVQRSTLQHTWRTLRNFRFSSKFGVELGLVELK